MNERVVKSEGNREALLEKMYAGERGVGYIRMAVVILNSLYYLFLVDKTQTIVWLIYVIIITACSYSTIIYLFEPYRKYPLFLSGYFTSILDTVFIGLWVLGTGGIESAFFPLWYLSLTGIAFRFVKKQVVVAIALYSASYLGIILLLGQLQGREVDVLIRLTYMVLIGAMGIAIGSEIYEQTSIKFKYQHLSEKLEQARDELEREKIKYETLVASMSEAVIAIDSLWRIIVVNKKAEELLQITKDRVIEKPLFQMLPFEDEQNQRLRLEQYPIQQAMQEGQLSKSLIVDNGNGKKTPVEIVFSPIIQHHIAVGVIMILKERRKNPSV